MKKILTTLCTLFCLIFTPLYADQTPLGILPLGDSITQAEINRASYRYYLWKKLIDADITFDFVGSMQRQQDKYSKGTPPQPDYNGQSFDRDHEGHFGWTIGHVNAGRAPNNGTGSGNLRQWVEHYDFDIALVHLGTNDVFYKKSNEEIAQQLEATVKTLRADNPRAVILLAQVIPSSKNAAIAQSLISMNAMIAGLAEDLSSRKSPIIVVDQHSGFDIAADSYDGVHPNASGEEKMAQRWFEAIERALPLVNR